MTREYYQMGWTLCSECSDDYYFSKGSNSYFIKENTSPIIATLSAEKIVPKLKWTKRLSDGNVIIAQDFESGRTLETEEMTDLRIAKILKKVHNSDKIKKVMISQGYKEESSKSLFNSVKKIIPSKLYRNSDICLALKYLKNNIPEVITDFSPCHTDVHKKNWLLSDSKKLFLVDWEGSILGDPAIDVSFVLYKYIPQNQWDKWLLEYGVKADLKYRLKLKWYITLQSLIMIVWYSEKQQFSEMNDWLRFLRKIFIDYI